LIEELKKETNTHHHDGDTTADIAHNGQWGLDLDNVLRNTHRNRGGPLAGAAGWGVLWSRVSSG